MLLSEGTQDLEPGAALDKLPSAVEFAKHYKARFNQDVELYAPFAYDATLAMIKAIHEANPVDWAKIVAVLPKVTVTGVTGKIEFDPHGDLIKPPYTLFQVQQGQWKSLRTVGGMFENVGFAKLTACAGTTLIVPARCVLSRLGT